MHSRALICDWDETITVSDTTELVAQTAYINKLGLPAFDSFVRIYSAAMREFGVQNWLRASIDDEINYQRRARLVEMTSIDAIVRAGVFLGLAPWQFASQAQQIELRPGFKHAIVIAKNTHSPIYILSVNWSKTLIEAALAHHGVIGIKVIANELEIDSSGKTTGRFNPKYDIRTGADKMDELERIRASHTGCELVYVGDSSGDVLPLRIADTGVVMRGGRARHYFAPLQQLQELKPGVFEGDWHDIARAWK